MDQWPSLGFDFVKGTLCLTIDGRLFEAIAMGVGVPKGLCRQGTSWHQQEPPWYHQRLVSTATLYWYQQGPRWYQQELQRY